MGFREEFKEKWTGDTIEYQGKNLLVIREVELEGKKYLYAVREESLYDDSESYKVVFLYRVDGDVFAHVQDDELFQRLLAKAGGEFLAEELKRIFK